MKRLLCLLTPAALSLAACSSVDGAAEGTEDGIPGGDGDGDGDGDGVGDGDGDGDGDGIGDGDGDGDGEPGEHKWDLGGIPDAAESDDNGCEVPEHEPCDEGSTNPFHAIGLNCPGELQFTVSYTGHADAVYVQTGQVGTYVPATYPVQEGAKMVILSSGIASQLTIPALFASTANDGNDPLNLPAPMNPTQVDPAGVTDCADNPALVGTGDCSNTIQAQWDQGSGAYDYAELRLQAQVPIGASGFSYQLAFFSTEYPVFYQTTFNDMYIAWLESELWTGNVSFDEQGRPISLNAGFLDYKDAANPYDCPDPCTAPELQGTAMMGHAGTKWLTTTAGVAPNENMTLVFAVFDLSDNILDSVVLLDNFAWNCEGGPPETIPG